jgi:hypothetical protein
VTGEEFARARVRLGYTQGALAQLLQVSTPTVSRMEAAGKEAVPEAHARMLLTLSPAPGGGRGPYRAKGPPALPRPKPQAATQPWQVTAQVPPEVVHEADAIGAVLLEGEDLRRYWAYVATWRQWLLAKRRHQRAKGVPCH